MIKSALLSLCLLCGFAAVAQDTTVVPLPVENDKPTARPLTANRSNDHFMLQLGYDGWQTTPDSLKPNGIGRSFNVYFMLVKPMKKSPNFSIAFGGGIGSSNVYFNNRYVDIKATGTQLPFRPFVSGTDSSRFDKFKLTTIYAELPLELRYNANRINPAQGFKAAIGVKAGLLLKAYTKGKDLQNKNGQSVYGDRFIEKEQNRRFINPYRLAVTARLGYGIFSVYGQYHFLNFLRDGAGPDIRPYSVGIAVSGL